MSHTNCAAAEAIPTYESQQGEAEKTDRVNSFNSSMVEPNLASNCGGYDPSWRLVAISHVVVSEADSYFADIFLFRKNVL